MGRRHAAQLHKIAHVAYYPGAAARVLDEEYARRHHGALDVFLGETFKDGALRLVVGVHAGQRVVDLGHMAVDIVVAVVQLDDVVTGPVVAAMGDEPVWRSRNISIGVGN